MTAVTYSSYLEGIEIMAARPALHAAEVARVDADRNAEIAAARTDETTAQNRWKEAGRRLTEVAGAVGKLVQTAEIAKPAAPTPQPALPLADCERMLTELELGVSTARGAADWLDRSRRQLDELRRTTATQQVAPAAPATRVAPPPPPVPPPPPPARNLSRGLVIALAASATVLVAVIVTVIIVVG